MSAMVPDPVRAVVDAMRSAGHDALVIADARTGGALGSGAPALFQVSTAAPARVVLTAFRRAVPIRVPQGAHERATIRIATRAGAVEVSCHPGEDTASMLARSVFSAAAIGFDPIDDAVIDPHGGREDLAAGRIRTIGDPARRLHEDPVRALRAARLVAELDGRLDPELEAALPSVLEALSGVPALRIRSELERLLVGPAAGAGIAVLRRAGLERALLGSAPPDAARVVDALPCTLPVRWAAWLRGAPLAATFARLRLPPNRRQRVQQAIALHPIDAAAGPGIGGALRIVRRFGRQAIDDALALRSAELEAAVPRDATARAQLRETRERLTLARARHAEPPLAISGGDVMTILGIPPGPAVGRMLKRLRAWVAEDTSRNAPESLRARLREEDEAAG